MNEDPKKHLEKISQFVSQKEEAYKEAQNFSDTLISIIRDTSKDLEVKLNIIEKLIEGGVDINIKNESQKIAWAWIYELNSKGVIRSLKSNGNLINSELNYGSTPLMCACALGDLEIVDLLIKKRANLNIQDSFGLTALMCAAKQGKFDVVKILIDSKAKLDIRSLNGSSAYEYAYWEISFSDYYFSNTQTVHAAIMKLLEDAGANKNISGCNII